MAKTAEYAIDILNDVLATCRDRQEGYETARNGVANPELKHLFESFVDQSSRFRHELERLIRQHGGQPRAGGSLAGAAFHGWMDLKAAITRGDEVAILAECERGEDAAVSAYRKALSAGLPSELDTVIAQQASAVEQAHVRIKGLRDAARVSPSQ